MFDILHGSVYQYCQCKPNWVRSASQTYVREKKMASNTQGIQQLLAAEKKAADKVGDARKRK